MLDEIRAMLDSGWTVSWMTNDGQYIVTATHPEIAPAAGIGPTMPTAWTMVRNSKWVASNVEWAGART